MTGVRVLIGTTALGAGLVGGVFFAFSGFVMPALRRLPATQGVAAMQTINLTAVTAPLMTALFGTATATIALPILARRSGASTVVLLVIAGTCYLVGVIGVTAAANVPLNNQLAATPIGTITDLAWSRWVVSWSQFNLVRTVAALTAAALYSTALLHAQPAAGITSTVDRVSSDTPQQVRR